MSITSAIVLFAVIWFLLLLILLPLGTTSQEEAGEIVPGTPASAPSDLDFKKVIIRTTLATLVLWAITCGIILSGWITIDMFDFYGGIDNSYLD
ncbi:MAG: DUF1467 family protein [Pseudomonadota bacterium]